MREATRTEPIRVLVVDDLKDTADSLGRLLKVLGFDTRIAYSGQEALELARSYLPDCVLSDVGMPGIDGYQLASLIRQDESLKPMLLVAITAYADAERAKGAGFDYHLVKPADPRALAEMLKRVLQIDNRLERAAQVLQDQSAIIEQAIDVIQEVKADVKEIKQGLKEVKEDVKEIKVELKDDKTSTA